MSEGIDVLIGRTLKSVTNNDDDSILFVCQDGDAFQAYHMEDCCEYVRVHDIAGELQDLVGAEIVSASEEVNSEVWPDDVEGGPNDDSFTWTVHRIATASATVVVRWLGESNGYYGEDVHFGRTHSPLST